MKSGMKWLAVSTAVLCHTWGFAWTNSFDPTVSPVIEPVTQKQTDIWKLVGMRGSMIAPHWIITVQHYGDAPGQTYTNSYGSSTIDQCFQPEYAVYSSYSLRYTPDLMICRLKTAINLPAGMAYPALVENPNRLITSTSPIE